MTAGHSIKIPVILLCLLLAVVFAPFASADTIYTYTGQPFTGFFVYSACPPSNICSLSGSFTLASPLPGSLPEQSVIPVSYSFTDGSNILTQTNSSIVTFDMGTDAGGKINAWGFFLLQGSIGSANIVFCSTSIAIACNAALTPIFDISALNAAVPVANAFNDAQAGSWTGGGVGGGNTTPEPPSLILLGTGLLCLATILLSRQRLA